MLPTLDAQVDIYSYLESSLTSASDMKFGTISGSARSNAAFNATINLGASVKATERTAVQAAAVILSIGHNNAGAIEDYVFAFTGAFQFTLRVPHYTECMTKLNMSKK
mmetsp:Transcript_8006/g.17375  ORF Transcript_8006/g.17375 Transcript_8006/m.17375 type:complete len:108 (-) Transcript_8006:1842-2165(-)